MKNQHGRLQHRIGIGSVPHFTLPSGKEKCNSENFAARFAGYIVAYQRWQKETSAQLKTTLRKSRKKHARKPVFAPKKRFLGSILRFTLISL
jgi:hypothetical protein